VSRAVAEAGGRPARARTGPARPAPHPSAQGTSTVASGRPSHTRTVGTKKEHTVRSFYGHPRPLPKTQPRRPPAVGTAGLAEPAVPRAGVALSHAVGGAAAQGALATGAQGQEESDFSPERRAAYAEAARQAGNSACPSVASPVAGGVDGPRRSERTGRSATSRCGPSLAGP
jgi:hypothetical protein